VRQPRLPTLQTHPGGADIPVVGRCPGCGYTWHLATIRPGMWWADGLTPTKCCKNPYCPKCEHKPPMILVSPEEP